MDLPPPWELRESSRYPGRCFYYNTDTHESSWFRPIPYPGHRIAWPPAVFVLHILVRDSDEAQEKITLQVNQGIFKQTEAQKRLAMSKKNMEKAEENLRYAEKGFKEGVIPVSNVMEAQTAWLSAQSEQIDAQIDVRLAQAYLQKAMGTLDAWQ